MNPHNNPLFKRSSIIELQDKICLQNIFFVSKSLNILSPSVLNTCLNFSVDQHLPVGWSVGQSVGWYSAMIKKTFLNSKSSINY